MLTLSVDRRGSGAPSYILDIGCSDLDFSGMQVLITAGWGPVAAVRLSALLLLLFGRGILIILLHVSAEAMYFVTRDQRALMTGR